MVIDSSGTTRATGDLIIAHDSTTTDAGNTLAFHTTTAGWSTANAHATISGKRTDASNGYLTFSTRGSGTTTERMRIDSDGRVHIRKYAQFMQNDGTTVAGLVGNANTVNGTNQADLALYSARYVEFSTGGNYTPRMVLDSGGKLAVGHTQPSSELHVKSATTSGITNTSNVGIYTQDARNGGAIYGGSDMNHSILFRYGRDDTLNVLDYHSYGSHRFYTNSSVQSQVERLRIASTGRVTVKKSSNAEVTALTDGATITPDFDDANNFSVTLGGNRTLANPSNCTAGQSGIITITQDGTGSRTLAYGSYWKFSGGTAPTLTTTASAVDVLAYYVESSSRITATLITDTK